MAIDVLARLSDPGAADRANEDAVGASDVAAWVIDGATGLGAAPLIAGAASDAAWLAARADAAFAVGLGRAPVARVVADLCADVAATLARLGPPDEIGPSEPPAWALPTASFAALIESPEGPESVGLGDCAIFLLDAAGGFARFGPDRGAEQSAARAAAAATSGLGSASGALRDPRVLERLRADRATRNRPGGLYTLGVAPEAAAHLTRARLAPRRPALALLATDGFADLVDLYGVHDGAGLVRAAAEGGLAPLVAELRRLERSVDPEGRLYPRFKRSDDATALLVRLS